MKNEISLLPSNYSGSVYLLKAYIYKVEVGVIKAKKGECFNISRRSSNVR